MRPIVAAYGSFNVILCKQFVFLKIIISSKSFSVKKSYDFANTLRTLSDANNSYMRSLDISSLYTNMPATEIMDLILNNIYTNGKLIYKGINRQKFQKFLQLAFNNTFILNSMVKFLNKRRACNGCISFADRCKYFSKLFWNKVPCRMPDNFKPQVYRRYLYDTFLVLIMNSKLNFLIA